MKPADQPGGQPPAAPAGAAPKQTRLAGVATSIGRSAEYAVAIALVSVCLIVAGAAWLLKLREEPSMAATVAVPQEEAQAPVDGATPADWNTALQGKVSELEQERKSMQERTEAERKRALEAQQAAAAQAAAEAQKRKLEEEKAAAAAAATAAARAATAKKDAPQLASAAPAAKKDAVVVGAKVDWSTCSQPKYPDASMRQQEEGTVVMAFQIDAGGHVLGSRLDKSSGSKRLDQSALSAIGKCRFTPAKRDGVAETAWTFVRFVWKLEAE